MLPPPIYDAEFFTIKLGSNTSTGITFIHANISIVAVILVLEDTVELYPPPIDISVLFTFGLARNDIEGVNVYPQNTIA